MIVRATIALPAQTLSSADPAAPVEVLAVARDVGDQVMTAYAVRKTDGALGVLLLNKSDRSYDVAVNLPAYPQTVTARRIVAPATARDAPRTAMPR